MSTGDRRNRTRPNGPPPHLQRRRGSPSDLIMAETSVRRESSGGDRPNRAKRSRPPSPPMGPRDLISDLPDAVIDHIFSFLPLRDVVKTSVLSKRWQSTWTTTAHLVFDDVRPRNPDDTYSPDCSHDARSSDLPSVLDSVLSRCTSPAVKRFHIINFNCDEPKLDPWLRFAEERRVEDLRLRLDAQPGCFYKLPRFLYCSSRLVRLEAWSCCLSLGTAIRWPCLKVLSLSYAGMSDDILEGIVRGSPVLESLELHCCRGVKNILIDSTSVKELILAEGRLSNLQKIRAPHLLSLQVSGIWGLHSVCRLDDMSSLVEVKLDFLVCGENGKGHDLFKELLEKTRGVSTITIGCWFLQILFVWEMEVVASPLSKCQNLILHAPVDRWTLPGIAYMLQSEQCLEKFVINLTGYGPSTFELDKKSIKCYNFDEDLSSWKRNYQCLAKHLKRVEIIGFAYPFWSKHLLALIKFLLGDALALEKMIIKVDLHAQCGQKRLEAADLSKLLGVCREVLRYRRASQNAEVIFNYPLEEVSFESLKSI